MRTPGPWEAGFKASVERLTGEGVNFSNGDWGIYPPLGKAGPVAIANSADNARLISKAPEMLDLLFRSLGGSPSECHDEIRELIAYVEEGNPHD